MFHWFTKVQISSDMQVYRSVLLNSGPRHRPRPDTSTTSEEQAPPTASSSSVSGNASGNSGTAAASSEESTVALKDTPVDQLLYRPELEVGSRGDIIQFYNKLFIGFIKDFVLKFSPNEPEVCVCLKCHTFLKFGTKKKICSSFRDKQYSAFYASL